MKPEYYQKIWNKVLSSDEKTVYEFGISGRYIKFFIVVYLIVGLVFLLSMGAGLVIFLVALFYYGFYLKAANAYAFTNKRVLIHTGWLSTSLKSIDYDKITDVKIDEGFVERILYKTGSITINTAGTGVAEVILAHIDKPYEVKKQLEAARGKNI